MVYFSVQWLSRRTETVNMLNRLLKKTEYVFGTNSNSGISSIFYVKERE